MWRDNYGPPKYWYLCTCITLHSITSQNIVILFLERLIALFGLPVKYGQYGTKMKRNVLPETLNVDCYHRSKWKSFSGGWRTRQTCILCSSRSFEFHVHFVTVCKYPCFVHCVYQCGVWMFFPFFLSLFPSSLCAKLKHTIRRFVYR